LFRYSTIKDYHKELQNGQTTCVEAVHCYLDAITCKTFTSMHFLKYMKLKRWNARQHWIMQRNAHEYFPLLPLHGVVVGLKDVISYKGHHLSAASRILENFTAVYNATAVDKLISRGRDHYRPAEL
jgi:aspartyl-tRNA(Asn)/glutamyl-tRNA(Gln) amidotransferase subunit A